MDRGHPPAVPTDRRHYCEHYPAPPGRHQAPQTWRSRPGRRPWERAYGGWAGGTAPSAPAAPRALVWRVLTVIRVSHSTHRPYRASRPPWAAVLSGVCGPTKSRPAEGTKRDIADVLITKCPSPHAHETPSTPNPRIWPSALRWSAQHPPIEETHDSRFADRQPARPTPAAARPAAARRGRRPQGVPQRP